ncbi:hypothetical protein BRD19_11565 [Halobacteriales archaeon SW_7_65_23]|nr:MAG: hypothetical protein BRD19_11565 [Halobacteriales archaeon SW_7_65_23]
MDRRRLLAGAGCAVAAVLAGCFGDDSDVTPTASDAGPGERTPDSTERARPEQPSADGWTQARQDSQLSGTAPGGVPADSQLTRSWEIDLSPPDEFRPEHISPLRATANGQVYVATVTRQDDPEGVDDSIRVITLARIVDGTLESRIHARVDPLLSGTALSLVDLAVTDDTAVCSFRTNSLPTDGSLSGELVTFDLSDGEWKYARETPGGGPITISGETIYVGTVEEPGGFDSEDGTAGVAAIETQTGTVRWQNELAEFSFAGETYPPSSMRPAVYGGSVYVSSPDGIHRLDPATGTSTVITERDGPCLIDGNRGLLYVLGGNEITALDLTLGSASVAGAVTVEGTLRGAAVSDGTLVVTTDGSITALDVTADRTLWRHTEETIISLPSIAGDTVYYLGIDGLRCRSLSSGEGIRSSPVTLRDDADQLPESVSREPIVADGSVFVRSRNAVLAIEATDSS